jgi:hypothetical protein
MGGHREANTEFLPQVAGLMAALVVAGCAGGRLSSSPAPEPAVVETPPEIPPSIRTSEIVGRWGYAAYHREQDRVRTEAAARAQCSQPYVIGQGSTGGLMMYPADQAQLQELRLKGSANGQNYIGPSGQTPGPQDREIVSFDGRVMLLRFVDPEVSGRYGTGVYVRCT